MKTKEQIEAFIIGVQSTFELGDYIDERKQLDWIVTDMPLKWSIKACWVKAITCYPLVNPMTDLDDVFHYDDYYFSVTKDCSPRKLCKEIIDALEVVNQYEFKEY